MRPPGDRSRSISTGCGQLGLWRTWAIRRRSRSHHGPHPACAPTPERPRSRLECRSGGRHVVDEQHAGAADVLGARKGASDIAPALFTRQRCLRSRIAVTDQVLVKHRHAEPLGQLGRDERALVEAAAPARAGPRGVRARAHRHRAFRAAPELRPGQAPPTDTACSGTLAAGSPRARVSHRGIARTRDRCAAPDDGTRRTDRRIPSPDCIGGSTGAQGVRAGTCRRRIRPRRAPPHPAHTGGKTTYARPRPRVRTTSPIGFSGGAPSPPRTQRGAPVTPGARAPLRSQPAELGPRQARRPRPATRTPAQRRHRRQRARLAARQHTG